MDLRFTNDPRAFADLAEAYMRADPFSTNVIGVRLAAVLDGHLPPGPGRLVDRGR